MITTLADAIRREDRDTLSTCVSSVVCYSPAREMAFLPSRTNRLTADDAYKTHRVHGRLWARNQQGSCPLPLQHLAITGATRALVATRSQCRGFRARCENMSKGDP
jgi:hypothetical protein